MSLTNDLCIRHLSECLHGLQTDDDDGDDDDTSPTCVSSDFTCEVFSCSFVEHVEC